MTQKVNLNISGMSCKNCAAHVEKALKGVPGVTEARVDLKAGKATVDYDPAKAGEKEMAAAVKKAGYSVV